MAELTMTEIGRIRPNPFQVRQIDDSELGDLVMSIKENGFIGALEVTYGEQKSGMAQPMLVDGHRRLRAAQLAGHTHVPTRLVKRTNEQLRVLSYLTNSTQRPLTFWEEAQQFAEMHEKADLSYQEIANLVGKSKSYVQARMEIIKIPDGPLKEAAKEGQASISMLRILMAMDPAERMQLFDRVKKGEVDYSDLRSLRKTRQKIDLFEEPSQPRQESTPILPSPRRDPTAVEAIHEVEPDYPAPRPLGVTHTLPRPQAWPAAAQTMTREVELERATILEVGADLDSLPDGRYVRPVHDQTVFLPSGHSYAIRLLDHTRAVRRHMAETLAKADLSKLSIEERRELRDNADAIRGMLVQL